MKKTFLLVLLSVLMVDSGQLLIKHGLNNLEADITLSSFIPSLPLLFSDVFIVCGIALFALSSLSWLSALSRADLSYAYPMLSMGYIVVALLSWLFFSESMGISKLVGIFIIAGGVAFLAKT